MKKTIFVLGAGKGLGTAVGKKFGENNFRVVLMARNAESLKKYAEEFTARGIEVYTQTADCVNNAGLSRALNDAVEKYGTPDVFIYNVGVTSADSEEANGIDSEILKYRYQVDVIGAYHCIKQIAGDEFAKKHGAVLITGGGLAMYPSADYLPLSMDKAALRTMVKALHPILKEKGIFLGTLTVCNVIAPGSNCAPEILADKYWEQYTERTEWEIICQ